MGIINSNIELVLVMVEQAAEEINSSMEGQEPEL